MLKAPSAKLSGKDKAAVVAKVVVVVVVVIVVVVAVVAKVELAS